MKLLFKYILMVTLFVILQTGKSYSQVDGKTAVMNYVNQNLAKGDTGFGWEDQPDRHLTPTYAAIGIMHHLNELPADASRLTDFVRTHHPQRNPQNREAGNSGTELRNLVYQQVQSLLWLGDDVSDFKTEVARWESQAGKGANFELHDYPAFMQEMMTPVVRNLLEMPQDERIVAYLKERRHDNGSYNNAPSDKGGDGNILNTWWGVYAWSLLRETDELKAETGDWVKLCQMENGGFTHQPDPTIGVNDEISYTWAAVKTLDLLGLEPNNRDAVIRYLLSLQNPDGGFGNRPALPSTPMSTFYAIDALKTLNTLSSLESEQVNYNPDYYSEGKDYSDYKIYTAQFQAPGSGSIREAVMLADSLNIHLWGAKNAEREWILAAQKMADKKDVPVTFFHSNEDYGKHVTVDGMGIFNHLFDPIFPVERNYKSERWTGREQYIYSWQSFTEDYVEPLLNDNGALLWQVSHNEPLTRLLLDESVNNGGYVAFSSVHFNQNFLFWLPHLYQYRDQLSIIALQDFHGSESWWWTNELVHYRTLFLAKEPTYDAMLNALKNREVVTVRHDELTSFSTRILGGAPGVQDYILSKKEEWKWWDNETQELNHPWASLTILKPDDKFEKGKPEMGISIRIRCWWMGPRQTLQEPMVDLVHLKINGDEVYPDKVEEMNNQGNRTDVYYIYNWADIPPGEYKIEATLKKINEATEKSLKLSYSHE